MQIWILLFCLELGALSIPLSLSSLPSIPWFIQILGVSQHHQRSSDGQSPNGFNCSFFIALSNQNHMSVMHCSIQPLLASPRSPGPQRPEPPGCPLQFLYIADVIPLPMVFLTLVVFLRFPLNSQDGSVPARGAPLQLRKRRCVLEGHHFFQKCHFLTENHKFSSFSQKITKTCKKVKQIKKNHKNESKSQQQLKQQTQITKMKKKNQKNLVFFIFSSKMKKQ